MPLSAVIIHLMYRVWQHCLMAAMTANLQFSTGRGRDSMYKQAGKESIEDEKEFTLEFIKVYHSLPALWDVKCKEYSDKDEKEKQYYIALKKYRERYPQAQRKDVSKKINILRSNFKREIKRLNNLEKSGIGIENEIKLWYFDALSFIKDVETPRPARRSLIEKQLKKSKIKPNAIEQMVRLVSQRLKEPHNTFAKTCELWVIKLQEMDLKQALIAEKLINEVIFNGQLGRLDIRSSFVSVDRTSTQIDTNNQHFEFVNAFAEEET